MRKIKINFNSKNLKEEMESARKHFSTSLCADFELDLTKLNLIDASKITLLLSTELMRQNARARLNCLLKDKETLNIIKPRKLKNTFLSVTLNENKVREFEYSKIQIKTGSKAR